jgi:hypothetical protein
MKTKEWEAKCFNCGHLFKISTKQWLFSNKLYCFSCHKYFDNPFAPKFKTEVK